MTIEELHSLWDKTNKGKSAASEHDLQVECVRWFRLKYPKGLIYAVPNGSWCGYKQGRKLVAEGVVSGVPDLVVPMARKGCHALYIEMKNGKAGRVSSYQEGMIERLQSYGNRVEVIRSFDEFERIVSDYMN